MAASGPRQDIEFASGETLQYSVGLKDVTTEGTTGSTMAVCKHQEGEEPSVMLELTRAGAVHIPGSLTLGGPLTLTNPSGLQVANLPPGRNECPSSTDPTNTS